MSQMSPLLWNRLLFQYFDNLYSSFFDRFDFPFLMSTNPQALAAFYRQYVDAQMRTLERLSSAITRDQALRELLTENFVKGVDTLTTQDRMELANKLLARAGGIESGRGALALQALAAFVGGKTAELIDACDAYTMSFLFSSFGRGHSRSEVPADGSSNSGELMNRLGLSESQLLINSIYPGDSLEKLFKGVEGAVDGGGMFQSENEKSDLLLKCPSLLKDVRMRMGRLVEGWGRWLSYGDDEKAEKVNELVETLETLRRSRRIKLFYKLIGLTEIGKCEGGAGSLLKESFLTTLASCLRQALRTDEGFQLQYHHAVRQLAEHTQHEFFYVQGAGLVMDRWLDRQISKYSTTGEGGVGDRVKRLIGESVVLHAELRGSLIGAFREASGGEASGLLLPYGGGLDRRIIDFANKRLGGEEGVDVERFPRSSLNSEAVAAVLGIFADEFRTEKIEETVWVARRKGNFSKNSSTNIIPSPTPINPNQDLVDLLITETVALIPKGVLAFRAPPSRVRNGVYRVGGREMSFMTRGGRLFLAGGEDGTEWLAREYGVPANMLRGIVSKQPAAHIPAPTPSNFHPPNVARGAIALAPTAGLTRRPFDLNDVRLLYRLIRSGYKAKDEYWRGLWTSFCQTEKIPADRQHPKNQSSVSILQKFVELNLAYAVRKEWGRHLLFYRPGEGAGGGPLSEIPEDSGSDDETWTAGSRGDPSGGVFHKTRRCIAHQAGKCHRGAACIYAHSDAELRTGPTFKPPGEQSQSNNLNPFYKTRICFPFIEGNCSKGDACGYAHSQEELAFYLQGGGPVPTPSTRPSGLTRGSFEKRSDSNSRDSANPSPRPTAVNPPDSAVAHAVASALASAEEISKTMPIKEDKPLKRTRSPSPVKVVKSRAPPMKKTSKIDDSDI